MSAIMRRRRSLIGLSRIEGSCPEVGVLELPIFRTGRPRRHPLSISSLARSLPLAPLPRERVRSLTQRRHEEAWRDVPQDHALGLAQQLVAPVKRRTQGLAPVSVTSRWGAARLRISPRTSSRPTSSEIASERFGGGHAPGIP